MLTSTIFTISDDSGFLAIANADTYKSFVSVEWELSQLFDHFVKEMNNGSLIGWSTGSENRWSVRFVGSSSDKQPFREFYKTIEVTNGELFLTNYEDLTMAAQFEEHRIPAKQNAGNCIRLDNNKYKLIIRQLFDPKDCEKNLEGKEDFEIVVQADPEKEVQEIKKIFWGT